MWLCAVKFVSTRRVLSFWSGSFLSRGLFVKLLRISRYVFFLWLLCFCFDLEMMLWYAELRFYVVCRLIFVSRAMLCLLSRRLLKLTLLVCLRTPTCVPFMPSVSPSCPRTFSLPVGLEASALKRAALCWLISWWLHVMKFFQVCVVLVLLFWLNV